MAMLDFYVCLYILAAIAGFGLWFSYAVLLMWPTPRAFYLMQKIKGPKGHLLFGNALQLALLPQDMVLPWFEKLFKTYGSRVRFWAAGTQNVFLRDPNDIQVVLHSNQHITKGWEYLVISNWLDEGLLTSTGSKWQQRRKLLTPAFHFKILDDNMVTVNKNASSLVDKFNAIKDSDVEIDQYIPYCTLDVIGETAMGLKLNSQDNKTQKYVIEIKEVTRCIINRIMKFYLYSDVIYFFTKCSRYFKRSRDFLHEFSYQVIHDKKRKFKQNVNHVSESKGKIRYAFLDLLLEIEAQNPGIFSDKDIREEVDTFMFEGHDTTSAALSFIFFNLANYPEYQERVYQEQLEIFEDDREPTLSDLSKMTYLEKVIKESLRMYPSVPHMSRLLDTDLVFDDGTVVPSRTNVIISSFCLHYNEEYWPDPHTFDPERFSEQNVQQRHPYAYIPFSAGPRNCIGQKFAMMEIKGVISTVVRKLRIFPVTKREDFLLCNYLILRPSTPIKVKFEPR